MKKIYSILVTAITQVQGVFEYIGEESGRAYVRGENLSEPFIEDTLPKRLQDLQDLPLLEAKEQKIQEINAICNGFLKSFKSKALGDTYIYDGDLEDQINLMGAVSANVDMPFRCRRDEERSSKENILHTKEQLKQVYSDGIAYKAEIVFKCGVIKSYCEKLDNIDEVKRLTWESYEDIASTLNKAKTKAK